MLGIRVRGLPKCTLTPAALHRFVLQAPKTTVTNSKCKGCTQGSGWCWKKVLTIVFCEIYLDEGAKMCKTGYKDCTVGDSAAQTTTTTMTATVTTTTPTTKATLPPIVTTTFKLWRTVPYTPPSAASSTSTRTTTTTTTTRIVTTTAPVVQEMSICAAEKVITTIEGCALAVAKVGLSSKPRKLTNPSGRYAPGCWLSSTGDTYFYVDGDPSGPTPASANYLCALPRALTTVTMATTTTVTTIAVATQQTSAVPASLTAEQTDTTISMDSGPTPPPPGGATPGPPARTTTTDPLHTCAGGATAQRTGKTEECICLAANTKCSSCSSELVLACRLKAAVMMGVAPKWYWVAGQCAECRCIAASEKSPCSTTTTTSTTAVSTLPSTELIASAATMANASAPAASTTAATTATVAGETTPPTAETSNDTNSTTGPVQDTGQANNLVGNMTIMSTSAVPNATTANPKIKVAAAAGNASSGTHAASAFES